MFAKTVRITMCVLIVAMFISVVFPAGIGTVNQSPTQTLEPGIDNSNRNTGYTPESILAPIIRKLLYLVKDESGDEILVEIPEDLEKESVEEIIEDKLEGEHLQEDKPEEETQEQEKEEVPEGNLTTEPEEDPEQKEPTQVVLHAGYIGYFLGYLDGYLFCELNEPMDFEASNLYRTHPVSKYEWDFDGDGIYELESTSPEMPHVYERSGLYNMRVRITYNYNYTYYPYNRPYIPLVDVDGDSFTTATVQKTLEYEVRVSVGSEESGYPPILNFKLNAKKDEGKSTQEPFPDSENVIGIKKPDFDIESIVVYPDFPPDFPPARVNISQGMLLAGIPLKVHVRMLEVKNEVIIPHLNDCVIEFDASSTKNQNEQSQFLWDFGDGEYAEGMKVTHTYRKKGTYTATVHVDGWDCILSKTFVIIRGSEDPRLVFINNYYNSEDYLLSKVNEPLIIDVTSMVNLDTMAWCEWDFDGDGIYEVNTTETVFTKIFDEPGYFEINFKSTYTYESYPIQIWDWDDGSVPKTEPKTQIRYTYRQECWMKVAVANENGDYPAIPYFYVVAPDSYSWWMAPINEDCYDIPKNITYLHAYGKWDRRINGFNTGDVILNANSTFDPNGLDNENFTYDWDLGEGITMNGIKISHTYVNPRADYELELTVKNGIFNSTIHRIIRPRPYSPNIYLYREKPGYDSIRVIVDGRVTKTVPEVELGSEIVWEDVWIENRKLNYKGESYDFLYYEEYLDDPRTSEYGWILERDEQGRLFLNDEMLTLKELQEFFRNELRKTGLYEHEIEDFVDEWLGKGGRLFPGQKTFRYAIMYIPENVVEDIIQIETDMSYEEIIRVHFLVQPAGKNLRLSPPIYPKHKTGKNILHEWGVYSGESKPTHKKSNIHSMRGFMINEYEAYKMAKRKESNIVTPFHELIAETEIIYPLDLKKVGINLSYKWTSKSSPSYHL